MKDSSSNAPGKNPIKAVAKGTISKESLAAKFKRIFLSPDINSVGEFIFIDVFVPAIKDLIVNIIENTVNVAFFGNSSKRPYIVGRQQGNQQQRASIYWNSSVGQSRPYANQPVQPQQQVRAANNFRDITYPDKISAEAVLNELYSLISQYGRATVADLYSLSSVSSDNFTNNDYGWTNLQGSTVARSRDGYILDLPKPQFLPD